MPSPVALFVDTMLSISTLLCLHQITGNTDTLNIRPTLLRRDGHNTRCDRSEPSPLHLMILGVSWKCKQSADSPLDVLTLC